MAAFRNCLTTDQLAMKQSWKRFTLSVMGSAKRRGVLPDPKKLICADCGMSAQAYDHRDYSKPLDVVPVCYGCNLKRGGAWFPRWICDLDPMEYYPAAVGCIYPQWNLADVTPFKERYEAHMALETSWQNHRKKVAA